MSHGAETSPGAAASAASSPSPSAAGLPVILKSRFKRWDRILMNPASPSDPAIRGWAVATILAPEGPAPVHGMQALISYRMTRRTHRRDGSLLPARAGRSPPEKNAGADEMFPLRPVAHVCPRTDARHLRDLPPVPRIRREIAGERAIGSRTAGIPAGRVCGARPWRSSRKVPVSLRRLRRPRTSTAMAAAHPHSATWAVDGRSRRTEIVVGPPAGCDGPPR